MDKVNRYTNYKKECIEYFKKNYEDTRRNIVYGEGNPDADIMLIGEAPGKNEIEYKQPFIGQAGKNLDEFLSILGIERPNIYIANAVKFRPFKINPKSERQVNRPPNREELLLCRPYLIEEINLVRPQIIVTLGNTPLRVVLQNNKISIGEVHGETMAINNKEFSTEINVFPLYHPASIIYRRELKKVYEEDLHKLKQEIRRIGKS